MNGQINPTSTGGAMFRATLARAIVVTEYDADGQIIRHTATPREPDAPTPPRDPLATLTDAQRETVAMRKSACSGCEHNGGLTAVTVRCAGCGCAGLSLLNGTCKMGKWP